MLRVMTWNLNCGNKDENDVKLRLPSMNSIVQSQRPDVLAVQEAPKREHLVSVSTYKFHLAAEPHGYSLALFSHLEPQHGKTFEHMAGRHPLVRLTVWYRGLSIDVFTIHLNARNQPDDQATRNQKTQGVLNKISTETHGAFLLVGDFNLHGEEPGYKTLSTAPLIDCYHALHPFESGITFEGVHPPQLFDYIFASPDLANQLRSCYVLDTSDVRAASDHFPVVAEFE